MGGRRRWAWRIVWTRGGPQGSGIGGRVGRARSGRLLDRVRLQTSASTIVLSFRARYKSASLILFQALDTMLYSIMLLCGLRLLSTVRNSG